MYACNTCSKLSLLKKLLQQGIEDKVMGNRTEAIPGEYELSQVLLKFLQTS